MYSCIPKVRGTLSELVVHTGTKSLENSSAGEVHGCYERQTVHLLLLLLFNYGKYLKLKHYKTQEYCNLPSRLLKYY